MASMNPWESFSKRRLFVNITRTFLFHIMRGIWKLSVRLRNSDENEKRRRLRKKETGNTIASRMAMVRYFKAIGRTPSRDVNRLLKIRLITGLVSGSKISHPKLVNRRLTHVAPAIDQWSVNLISPTTKLRRGPSAGHNSTHGALRFSPIPGWLRAA